MIQKSVQVFIITLVAFFLIYPVSVNSVLDSCSVSISPGSVAPNSSATLSFSITNSAAQSIVHVRLISMEAAAFTITGANAGSWSPNVENSRIVSFTGGTISAGGSHSFQVDVSAGPETASASWLVRASDSGGGENPTNCGGSTSVSIAVPTPTPPTEPTSTTAPGEPTSTPAPTTPPSSSSNDSSSSSSSSSTSSSSPGPTATPTPPPDRTPPSISLFTTFTKPYKEPPLITGRATDDRDVQEVSYSLDGGLNWIRGLLANAGSTVSNFSFRLPNLDDGNYTVTLRARDTAGNIGRNAYDGLVIDKIPPQVGSSLFTLGSHMIYPSHKGTFRSTPGVSSQVVLSAIGGATTIELEARKNATEPNIFPFTRNEKNGLWYGMIHIEEPGIYELSTKALDGAGNETTTLLGSMEVLPSGTVTGEGTLGETTLTVYAFEESTKQFRIWDGSDFGQANPQPLVDGSYHLILPPGRYYLRIDSDGYKPLETHIVTLTEPTPIIQSFRLEKKQWNLPLDLSFLPFQETTVGLNLNDHTSENTPQKQHELVGKQLPAFSLEMPEHTLTDTALRGKNTVILFLNTWLPFTAEQITILSSVSSSETNAVVIFPQEHATGITQYQDRGDYEIPLYADSEGRMVKEFGLHTVPTYVFIDKKNMITEIYTGLLDAEGLNARILQ